MDNSIINIQNGESIIWDEKHIIYLFLFIHHFMNIYYEFMRIRANARSIRTHIAFNRFYRLTLDGWPMGAHGGLG